MDLRPGSSGRSRERRASPRVRVGGIRLRAADMTRGEHPMDVALLDISSTGVRLYTARELQVGDELALGEAAEELGGPLHVGVVRVEPRLRQGTYVWEAGCALWQPRRDLLDPNDPATLAGVQLLARTLEHLLNNQLSLTVGYAELLASDPLLSPQAQSLAQEALTGALAAAATVRRLSRIERIVLRTSDDGHIAPMLDLDRSLGTPPGQ